MPPARAQTSTEVKKAYKKNGPAVSERTHKQLQRGYELEQRAAREREAEKRRKLAKEKREEKERKEKAARKQLGVGLATQLIGYNHTQANLKKGMEAFLGVNKKVEQRRQEEEKRKEEELANKLEVIVRDVEKELFENDDEIEDAMLDLPVSSAQGGEGWADDDLDDDTLLEAHDLVMSDPAEEPINKCQNMPTCPAIAPPIPKKQSPSRNQIPSNVSPVQTFLAPILKAETAKEDIKFTRIHGPINRAVESALDKLPGGTIELLSQDTTTPTTDWTPAPGLLYKLNPTGLPPHRLRIKVGCVVMCLKDLNISSQLSKSQHVRVLRVGNERLECLTLDGQLAGTKTVITRVPFLARYRNDDKFPFTRIQYPVRVATEYVLTDTLREAGQSGFKIPSMSCKVRPPVMAKRPALLGSKIKFQASANPGFKLPGLPASRVGSTSLPNSVASANTAIPTPSFLDGWDDFLESGTQIARELSTDPKQSTSFSTASIRPTPSVEPLPPLSTQDLDFSLDDLETESQLQPVATKHMKATVPTKTMKLPPSVRPGPLSRTANIRRIDADLETLLPPSMRPRKSTHTKLKRSMAPPPKLNSTCAKKSCLPLPSYITSTHLPTTTTTTCSSFSDFGLSTQDATTFFDDDDDFVFGSPPITA